MICLCGRAIAENLFSLSDYRSSNVGYKAWLEFSASQLGKMIYSYPTFRRMVDSLLSESATDAVNLLRNRFVGCLDEISIHNHNVEEKKQAEFLTAEGVLRKSDLHYNHYCMASAFIDLLIRQYVIPQK